MKLIVGRILSAIISAGGWLLLGVRTVLDLIGYSTVPDDAVVAVTRLDQFLEWLLGVPWWAVFAFALISTIWLMWVSWRPHPGITVQEISKTPPPTKDGADAPERPRQSSAARKVFENEELYFWELATPGTVIIEDKTFVNCIIKGPAVVGFIANVTIDGLGLDSPDVETVLIQVEPDRSVAGVFGLKRCTFQSCRFMHTSIIGPKGDLDKVRSAFRSAD